MKKLIFLLVITPFTLNAQDIETWICQGIAASGLNWSNNRWEVREFGTRIYKVELRASAATISENNDPALFVMDCKPNTWTWSCSNDAANLEFNKEESTAVLMRFFGGIYPELEAKQKDPIYVEALECFEIPKNKEIL